MGFIRPSRELAPAEERRGGERTVDASPSRGSSVLPPPGRCAPAGRWLLPAQCQTIIEHTASSHLRDKSHRILPFYNQNDA